MKAPHFSGWLQITHSLAISLPRETSGNISLHPSVYRSVLSQPNSMPLALDLKLACARCNFHRAPSCALSAGGAESSEIALRWPQIVWLADLFTSTNWSATHVHVQTVWEWGKTPGWKMHTECAPNTFYWHFRKIRRAPRLECAFLGIVPLKTPTTRVSFRSDTSAWRLACFYSRVSGRL